MTIEPVTVNKDLVISELHKLIKTLEAENERLEKAGWEVLKQLAEEIKLKATLQSQNERLKQKLAWQPISQFKNKTGSYTFGMTVKFAAANNYTAFRSFNLEYTQQGELTQEGDWFNEYKLSDFQYFRPFDVPQPQKEQH